MKLKMIVLALGLVASAASQAALIGPDNFGNGEMILAVWDANQSYTKDLGITYNQFLASSNSSATWATQTSSSSTNWTNFLASANLASMQYAVLDARTGGTTGWVLSTINADSIGNVIGNFNGTNVTDAITQVTTYYGNVGSTGTFGSALHGDSLNAVGTAGYFQKTDMESFNVTYYGNSSLVGTNMAFELSNRQQSGNDDPIEAIQAGVVSFNNVGGNYVLQYSVQAVPEASGYAMTLAGLGLIGFFGLRRRNQA
jgi:hypothetical protein